LQTVIKRVTATAVIICFIFFVFNYGTKMKQLQLLEKMKTGVIMVKVEPLVF
tara:strand:- start:9212 stop:9367 length:156 start_codon:yes stop_codon:yes gene_type:complete